MSVPLLTAGDHPRHTHPDGPAAQSSAPARTRCCVAPAQREAGRLQRAAQVHGRGHACAIPCPMQVQTCTCNMCRHPAANLWPFVGRAGPTRAVSPAPLAAALVWRPALAGTCRKQQNRCKSGCSLLTTFDHVQSAVMLASKPASAPACWSPAPSQLPIRAAHLSTQASTAACAAAARSFDMDGPSDGRGRCLYGKVCPPCTPPACPSWRTARAVGPLPLPPVAAAPVASAMQANITRPAAGITAWSEQRNEAAEWRCEGWWPSPTRARATQA